MVDKTKVYRCRLVKSMENLEKASIVNGTVQPDKSDPEGMPHPDSDKPYMKGSNRQNQPVWVYNNDAQKSTKAKFANNYNDLVSTDYLSPNGKNQLLNLATSVAKDPETHHVPTGSKHQQSLRMRHVANAMANKNGYSIKEHNGGLTISAERHSGNPDNKAGKHSWHYDGKSLKFLGSTPISNLNKATGDGNDSTPVAHNDSRAKAKSHDGALQNSSRSGQMADLVGNSGNGAKPRSGVSGRDDARGDRAERVGQPSAGVGRPRQSRDLIKAQPLQKSPLVSENFSMQGKSYVDPSSDHIDTLHQDGQQIHVLNSPDPRHTHYVITENGKPNGEIIAHSRVSTVDEDDNHKNPFISHTYVEKPHREKGLATALKLAIVNHLGTVQSDTRLSPESNRGWEKLMHNKSLKVKIGKEDDPRSENQDRSQHTISLKKPK